MFTFASHAPISANVWRGVVVRIDPALHELTLHDGHEEHRNIFIAPHDHSEALMALVAQNDVHVRIEAVVDASTRRVSQLQLLVDPERLTNRLPRGGVSSEEFIIALACNVWRESRVPVRERNALLSSHVVPESHCWCSDAPLREHQKKTVEWMHAVERTSEVRYTGNLRLTPGWFVDVHNERITQEPSWRQASLKGGLCVDASGSGKTACALRLIAESEPKQDVVEGRYHTHGTLVVLPLLHLVAQWRDEVKRCWTEDAKKVVWAVQSRDLRELELQNLCEADLVITTSSFLKSPTYLDMVHSALGGRPRSRATLSAWMRQMNHREPLLEAIVWRRVIVDEYFQTDVRTVRLFSMQSLWGLSATVNLASNDAVQRLYLLLGREKLHHPNLLSALMASAVRGHAPHPVFPDVQTVRVEDEPSRWKQLELLVADERPTVVAVQSRPEVTTVRHAISTTGVAIRVLEGNLAQRSSTLHDFSSGVLVLCIDECIAGLQLPTVQRIVFPLPLDSESVREQAMSRCGRLDEAYVFA